MMKRALMISAGLTITLCVIHFNLQKKQLPQAPPAHAPVVPQIPLEEPQEPKPEEPQEPQTPEPDWKEYPPVRSLNDTSLGTVLLDIESHMPAGHIYRDNDKVTWAHETTHGINSNLRMKFSQIYYNGNVFIETRMINGRPVYVTSVRINGFYGGDNRAAIIQEPSMSKSRVAQYVPQSLRGGVFGLYVTGQEAWNDRPLYLYDEWISYKNGSWAGIDLASKGLWGNRERSETVLYMLEFNVYAIATCMAVQKHDSKYGDQEQLKNFTMWNISDAMQIYQETKQYPAFASDRHESYLKKIRESSDAEGLRQFARNYFGPNWCREVMGF